MELKKGLYNCYEMPTFATGCENPYISEYDEDKNCFLVSHNVSVSRWYTEETLRKLLSKIEVSDIDAAVNELKANLNRSKFEESDYPMYTEKCHFKCESQSIKCDLRDPTL